MKSQHLPPTNVLDVSRTLREPNRADRRARSRSRREAIRVYPQTASQEFGRWEWRFTQEHPAKKRSRNRRRNKMRRATHQAQRKAMV